MRLATAEAVVTTEWWLLMIKYMTERIFQKICAQGFLCYTTSISAVINAGMKYSVYRTLHYESIMWNVSDA